MLNTLRRNVIFSFDNNRSIKIKIITFLHKSCKLVFKHDDNINKNLNNKKELLCLGMYNLVESFKIMITKYMLCI